MDLYVARNGKHEGPYSVQAVLDMLSRGELKSDQLAWHAGLTGWVPLSQLLECSINNPTPLSSKPTTHGLGKASMVIGCFGLVAWPVILGMAAYGVATGHAERSPLLVVAGLMMMGGLAFNCLGAVLGLAGITRRGYSKTLSVVGTLVNAVQLLFTVSILCLGLARRNQQAAGRSPWNPATIVGENAVFQNSQGRAEARRRHEQKSQYLLDSTWGAYQHVGSRNDKWDAQVKELFTLYSQYLSRSDAGGDETYTRIGDLGVELKSFGCDDPMVRFVAPRFMRPRPAQTIDYAVDCQKVAQELADRGYPTNGVFFAILRASRGTAKVGNEAAKMGLPSADVLMKRAEACLRELLKDDKMPNAELYDACYQYLEASYEVLDSRTAGFERVDALFKELRPNSPVHYQMRGVFYVDYAWEARGDNYAKMVTAEAHKLMQDRLKLAERALKKAWELDPKDPQPAAEMIQVAMGQGQWRQNMEVWFNHAIEADPDNYDACKKKLHYLDPNWYGSADILLSFGRACLQAKNWESGLPFVLVEAHERLAGLRSDSRLYYETPDVWADIHKVYGTYLEKYPDARRRRTQYARLAALCGQWKIANEQFNQLGDHIYIEVFNTPSEYEELRRKAAERATAAKL